MRACSVVGGVRRKERATVVGPFLGKEMDSRCGSLGANTRALRPTRRSTLPPATTRLLAIGKKVEAACGQWITSVSLSVNGAILTSKCSPEVVTIW